VQALQFQLVEDTPSLTNDGRPKRWVVVRPRGGQTGILLARADGHQAGIAGQQSPVASGCSSAWTTSMRLISAWSTRVCDSCRRLATNRTGSSPCFSTLRATGGTSWAPIRVAVSRLERRGRRHMASSGD
jgi:hypothetical protein